MDWGKHGPRAFTVYIYVASNSNSNSLFYQQPPVPGGWGYYDRVNLTIEPNYKLNYTLQITVHDTRYNNIYIYIYIYMNTKRTS